ncbi:MAG: nitric-oxide reductase large subunit [Armatimonadota bacterium]
MPEGADAGAEVPEEQEDRVPRALKVGALVSFVVAMSILLIGGLFNRDNVPPYPERVVAGDTVVSDKATIMRGQHIYQRYGLMDHGSVWGHGSLRGMDFSAQTLHLMGESIRYHLCVGRYGRPYDALGREERAVVDALTEDDIKQNTYDPSTGELTISEEKALAFRNIEAYWEKTFGEGDEAHGFLPGTVKTAEERKDIAAFFFWTAWAAGTNRPDKNYTYTNNWPPDRSVGNVAPDQAILWSFAGIFALLVTLGLVIYIVHRYRFFYGEPRLVHLAQRIAEAPITISQSKTAKYFLVVVALFILQIMLGGLLAHYTVHPGAFYFKAIGKYVNFSWAKSWHLQLGILWIAVAWVGSALYIGPLVGGREPKKQGLLVDLLFAAVVLVAVGSLVGEVLSIKGLLGKLWFWFGHSGWEYLELGRFWHILLFVGLLGWLVIAYRALAPRLYADKSWSGLTWFYLYSAIAVVFFFGFGLLYNPSTHLTIADYWRWFVVHIWVEGIFEFFAAAAGALLLTSLGLVTRGSALRAAYLTAILAFSSGIVGTAHHYFWFGAPGFWMALGAVFSSLEPIPMILLASRAWMEYKSIRDAGQDFPYRWPLMFLVASAFWNFLGAGVFGFMINLPIINYYEHATYLTSNHGHTALFGTYGMLAIALALFVWRGLVRPELWNDRLLRVSFWGLNIGLGAMSLLSLLPVGILELIESYASGLWVAKSAEFFNRPAIQFLGQIRIVPDTVIILLGAVPLALFLFTSIRNLKKPEVGDGEAIFDDAEEEDNAAL